ASKLTGDTLDHARDGLLEGDVGRDRDGPPAARGKLGSRRLRLLLVAADDRDIGARAGKAARHAETDAAIAAGDDRHLALEIEQYRLHCCLSRVFQSWLCQIRIRPTAASAAPYPAHWISLIMKLALGQAITPVPWPIQSSPLASASRPATRSALR